MKKVLLVAFLTGVFLVFLAGLGVFSTWNLRLADQLYGGSPASDKIVIVGIDDRSLQEIGRWPWERSVFVSLLNHTSAKVVAFDIAFFEPTGDDLLLGEAMRAKNVVIASEFDFSRDVLMLPAKGFEGVETGLVNIYTDSDGVSRSVPVSLNNVSGFSQKIVERYLGKKLSAPDKLLVNFVGKPGSYRYFSASDVIAKNTDFEDSVVFVGAVAPDLHDSYIVPTSTGVQMPGVEIHANAVQTLLTKQFIRYQSFVSLAVFILLISLLSGFLYSRLRIWCAVGIMFAVIIVHIVAAIFVFRQGIILNLVYVPLTVVLVSLTSIGYLAASEAKHKKYILGIFGRYVSKDVVNHLLASKHAIELGGVEREVTALFADIRGFTAMSEKLTPHEVINVLNHYFGDMTDLVFANHGTLDKFIGDALFALWGSPLPDKEHAYRAVKCAIEIQERLKSKHTEGIPSIALGIGICSGPAVIGNMGSSQRQEFTAIGDTINTASRLSGTAVGGQIMITDSTYQLVKGRFEVKELEPLKVKGKEKPLVVYEVLKFRNTLLS